ncbi:MAG: tetratricopeptide repeat protein [Bacteroidota bacterium]|nr:tetratricopeptide repeat protein [Bacteroidota bacterium]
MISTKRSLIFIIAVLSLWLTSCGPSLSEITTDLIEQGRNDEAIARMRRALVNSPNDPQYVKLLAIAHYNKKQYNEAEKLFQQVLTLDNEDDQAAYYLAATYEATKNFDKAIQYYRLYNELTFLGEYRETVEARIKLLYRQQMEAEAQKALAMEQQLDVAKIPANTIAILYFENKGQRAELNPLQKGLSEMVITDLSKVKSLKVVERVRLQELVQEMNLGETDIVDQKTAPRLGKLLGANRLVKGSFFNLTNEKLNIDAFVTKARTGEIDVSTNISGDIKDFFRLEKDLVFKIIDEMKIKLSDEERKAILEIPTEDFFAFLQYSRGLDFEDKGQFTQAYEAYSQAAVSDPSFSQAKTNASSAKKSEQIVGETSTSGEQQQSTEKNNGNQQQTSNKNTSTRTTSNNIALPPPPPPPLSDPGIGGNIVGDMINNVINNINDTVIPGANSQNTPPTNVISVLPEPKAPPQN